MLGNFLIITEDKLKKSLDVLRLEFSKITLNKVNVGLIKTLSVVIDNDKFFLEHIAVISVDAGNIVLVKPFDKHCIPNICNEIIKLKMDLNPFVVGDAIKVVFPIVTMERRQDFVKRAKKIVEDIKVSIRNIRKHVNQDVKLFLKSNKVSADDEKKFFIDLQKVIDLYIDKIDILLKKKEIELLNI